MITLVKNGIGNHFRKVVHAPTLTIFTITVNFLFILNFL